MANAIIDPTKGQLIVEVNDLSAINDIKRAIRLMRGVSRVTLTRHKRPTEYELSMRDLRDGRVNDYSTAEDFIKAMEK